jgi:predicted regulator of Ras-like GTPase activity (Roadblock/LC7/MglB family)
MEETNWDDRLDLCDGITIYPAQAEEIEKVLSNLKESCPAQFILLADISGHLITSLGGKENNHLVELASLIAGDLAASQEIAHLTGQFNTSQLVMREGQNAASFLAEAGAHMTLFVQVTRDVPLGWARLIINETGRKIAEIMKVQPAGGPGMKTGLDDGQFSNAVGNAFDSMWNG